MTLHVIPVVLNPYGLRYELFSAVTPEASVTFIVAVTSLDSDETSSDEDEKEKELMYAWNLTAKTILHTEEWKKLFIESGYTGDFFWFKP